jgi:hypothetical protein
MVAMIIKLEKTKAIFRFPMKLMLIPGFINCIESLQMKVGNQALGDKRWAIGDPLTI